uniref:Protocadherin gamma-C3 n=1 Tax=Capra hircus TaxID=9925 RepID=A0A8C2QVN4_CAPHI
QWRRWRSGPGPSPLVLLLLGALQKASAAVIRYEILEEREKGSVVGNVVRDLDLDLGSLSARRLRVVSGASRRFFEVNWETGEMFVNDRLDREELCGTLPSCTITLELVVERPLELFSAEVVIQDINDNNPSFPTREMKLEISEAMVPGTRFPLEIAHDPDVGSNSLQTYELSRNEYFALRVQTREDSTKYAELVLERSLDREREPGVQLVLTALDGGTPARSASLPIRIVVLDANDNAPTFNQSLYRARVLEDAPPGTRVVQVRATDLDEGPNGEIIYSFSSHNRAGVRELFSLDLVTGVLTVKGRLDFEDAKLHEIYIQAKDKGANPEGAHCKVLVEVVDVNDNAPEITVTSVYSPVPEDAPLGTVIALLSVTDLDAGENGLVTCEVPPGLPFSLISSLKNYFTLKTSAVLDRETVPEYNLSITARDAGTPSLSALTTVRVQVSDINDNPPQSSQSSYNVFVPENNRPGDLLCSLAASDPDSGLNALISYSLLEPRNRDVSASSFISLNPQTGAVHATRSFDYEQTQTLQFEVQARDRGNPPLSSTVTVRLFVLDLNDNAPAVLRPRARPGSLCPQALPPSVGAGHLVTKVTAVDLDSGYNAWVSYQLLEAPDPSLFAVSRYAGEVRTAVPIPADLPPQKLVIVVKDSGSPPLSTSVTLLVSLEEDTHPVVPDLRESSAPREGESRLTLYLAVSLVAICFVSFGSFVALISKCLRGAACGMTCFPAGTCACLTRSRRREGLPPSSGILRIQLGSDDPIKFVDVGGHSHGCTPLASGLSA